MKYLYYTERYGNEHHRCEVSRETDANYWIVYGNTERKLSKKTMRIGTGWDSTRFSEETEELKKQFFESYRGRMFHRKLKELEKCKDPIVMQAVIDIKI